MVSSATLIGFFVHSVPYSAYIAAYGPGAAAGATATGVIGVATV